MLERQVVRDPEQPAAKVRPGPAELHVPEQREEHVLYNVLRVVSADAERPDVPQQRRAAFVKQREHLGFDLHDLHRVAGPEIEDCREDESRIGLRHRVRRFYTVGRSKRFREQTRAPENTRLENIL